MHILGYQGNMMTLHTVKFETWEQDENIHTKMTSDRMTKKISIKNDTFDQNDEKLSFEKKEVKKGHMTKTRSKLHPTI
jgi:hypothetical protein